MWRHKQRLKVAWVKIYLKLHGLTIFSNVAQLPIVECVSSDVETRLTDQEMANTAKARIILIVLSNDEGFLWGLFEKWAKIDAKSFQLQYL